MQTNTINNHQRINPSFQARLVSDRAIRKVIQNQLADYFAKSIDTKTCPALTKYKNLTGSQAYKWFQNAFRAETKGKGGTFKLTEDPIFAAQNIFNVAFKNRKGVITTQTPETSQLFPHEILPSVVEGPDISFSQAIKKVVGQIFKD